MIVPVAGGKFAKVHSPPTKTGTLFECRVLFFCQKSAFELVFQLILFCIEPVYAVVVANEADIAILSPTGRRGHGRR